MNKRLIFYILLLIILFFSFLIRLWPIQITHWWDEAVYLQHSEVIFSGADNYDEFHLRPPMLSLIFAFGYLFWHHMFTASIIVALIGVLGVFFTYLAGRELYDDYVGLLAAVFFGFSPFIVKSSHSIMTDVPSLSFVILSFYLLLISFRKNSDVLMFFSGFFFAIAILTRFTSLILLFVIFIYFWINKIYFSKILLFSYGLSVILLPYFIWAQLSYGFFLIPFINANSAVSDSVGGVLFYVLNFLKIFPLIIVIGFLFYFSFIFFGKLKKFSGYFANFYFSNVRISKNELVLLSWIFLFLIYISVTPHKEIRYIIPIAFPLYILSARGFLFIFKNENLYKFLFFCLMLILSFYSFSDSFSRLEEPFFNTYETSSVKVSKYLDSLEPSIVYSNFDYPVYAYYTGMKVIFLQNQDSHFYNLFPGNMKYRGYFLYYENSNKEPNYEWLESNSHFIRLNEIDDVIIYRYTP